MVSLVLTLYLLTANATFGVALGSRLEDVNVYIFILTGWRRSEDFVVHVLYSTDCEEGCTLASSALNPNPMDDHGISPLDVLADNLQELRCQEIGLVVQHLLEEILGKPRSAHCRGNAIGEYGNLKSACKLNTWCHRRSPFDCSS